jgi:predicted deacylase
MVHRVEPIALRSSSPGTVRSLTVHHIGQPGARPKAYLQAGLHANEIPGLLVLHHLLDRLLSADREGRVAGEVVLVPYANPIGLGETVLGNPIGRLSLDSGTNFNRGFPDLAPLACDQLAGRLSSDAAANVAAVRGALLQAVAAWPARRELDDLRLTLLRLAIDSDLLFDLHSEEDAQFAVIAAPWAWPELLDFACDMQPDCIFIADAPLLFDTTCSKPWHDLAARFGPGIPIPQACLSATLELRGVAAVSDSQARSDADGLFRYLQRRGVLAGVAGPPTALRCEPISFSGVEFVRALSAGVVVYREELGAELRAGTVLCEIVDPASPDPAAARCAVRCSTDGIFFAKRHTMLVRPDDVVAKVAGAKLLANPNHY